MHHERCNISASFKEHQKILRKSDLYTCILGEQWQIKLTRIRILYVLKMLYTGDASYRRRKQYHCFLRRTLRISRINKKLKSIIIFDKTNKNNQEIGFMILSTLKLLYTGCFTKGVMSLLLSWSS